MALGVSDTDRLMQALYRAAATPGADGWRTFLTQLADQTRAATAGLLVETPRGLRRIGPLPAIATEDLRRLRTGRVYSAEDGLADHPLRIVRVTWQRTLGAWLVIGRRGDDFRALDSALLSGLAPHIATALEIWDQRNADAAEAAIQAQLTHDTGFAALLLDASGRAVAVPAATETLLRGTVGVALSTLGTLSFDDTALRLPEAPEKPEVMALPTEPPLHLLLWPLPPDHPARIACPEARTLALFRKALAPALPAPLIAQLFDLPHSEARLAAALAHGASLSQAAEALGLTLETARNYSKKIFARTGLHGQPDLIRALLSSVLTATPKQD